MRRLGRSAEIRAIKVDMGDRIRIVTAERDEARRAGADAAAERDEVRAQLSLALRKPEGSPGYRARVAERDEAEQRRGEAEYRKALLHVVLRDLLDAQDRGALMPGGRETWGTWQRARAALVATEPTRDHTTQSSNTGTDAGDQDSMA